jgi:hypothetical protein
MVRTLEYPGWASWKTGASRARRCAGVLVPGATGLIGVTQIVGNGLDVASRGLSDVLVTIISISLGVLIGTSAHRTADAGFRRLLQFFPSM